MKSKTLKRKLVLRKETIAVLNLDELDNLYGGNDDASLPCSDLVYCIEKARTPGAGTC
jgi:hypothetical protein